VFTALTYAEKEELKVTGEPPPPGLTIAPVPPPPPPPQAVRVPRIAISVNILVNFILSHTALFVQYVDNI